MCTIIIIVNRSPYNNVTMLKFKCRATVCESAIDRSTSATELARYREVYLSY